MSHYHPSKKKKLTLIIHIPYKHAVKKNSSLKPANFNIFWRETYHFFFKMDHPPTSTIWLFGGLGWFLFGFLGSPKMKGIVTWGYPDSNPRPPGPKPLTFCEAVRLGVEHPRKKYVIHGSSIRDKMVAPKLCATTNHPNPPKKPNKTYKKVTSSWKLQKQKHGNLKKHTFDLRICTWPKKQQ